MAFSPVLNGSQLCELEGRRLESPTTRRNDILPVHVNNEQARASTGRPSGRSRNNTDSSIIFMQTSVELFRFFSLKTKLHGSYYIPFANDYIVIQIFLLQFLCSGSIYLSIFCPKITMMRVNSKKSTKNGKNSMDAS